MQKKSENLDVRPGCCPSHLPVYIMVECKFERPCPDVHALQKLVLSMDMSHSEHTLTPCTDNLMQAKKTATLLLEDMPRHMWILRAQAANNILDWCSATCRLQLVSMQGTSQPPATLRALDLPSDVPVTPY